MCSRPNKCAGRLFVQSPYRVVDAMENSKQSETLRPAVDVCTWLEQASSVMLKAVTNDGDPVELTAQETRAVASALMELARRLESSS
jgi:hypothetical protein